MHFFIALTVVVPFMYSSNPCQECQLSAFAVKELNDQLIFPEYTTVDDNDDVFLCQRLELPGITFRLVFLYVEVKLEL